MAALPRLRLEWQSFAGIALAVHSGLSSVIAWPLATRLLQTSVAPSVTSQISFHDCQRYVVRIRLPKAADECEFLTHVFSRIIVRIAQRIRPEFMACVTHAPQIDLRFGDPARQFLDFGVGACPGNFARERFHLFARGWVGTNGKAQPRGEARFAPIERGPGRFAGRYWPARWRGWPSSCGRSSSRVFSFLWRGPN